jgi:hypothetical protein
MSGCCAERGNLSSRWEEKISSGGSAREKVSKRGTGAEQLVVCARQRLSQEGWSPSGARTRSVISKSGSNASLAFQ